MTQKSEIILKLKDAIQNIGERNATDLAEKLAKDMGLDWDGSVSFIFKTIAKDLERVPVKIGAASDNEHQVINKWLKKYQKGMAGCPSKRISGPLTTIADPIIEEIIGARLTRLKKATYTR